jgi:hypothetical protein
VTANVVLQIFDFAVAVSNTTAEIAHVTIDEGGLAMPVTFDVAPSSVQVQTLPWVPSLKACWNQVINNGCGRPTYKSEIARQGAFHVRSTQPVTVYQFNPLEYEVTEDGQPFYSYTNDASVLFPTNAWTRNYMAVGWQASPTAAAGEVTPGALSITASADNTTVTVVSKAPTQSDMTSPQAAPVLTAGVPTSLTLNRGDVVQFLNFEGDFTGSSITSDRPIQVITAHYETEIPLWFGAADHLEESMFPLETLSKEYVVSAPATPAFPGGRKEIVRIVATRPDTMISANPPAFSPHMLANPGDFFEVPMTTQDFVVTGSKSILVAQYMLGQDVDRSTVGDPSLTLAVGSDQFRSQYLFHAPTTYQENYVNVMAPLTATIMLDGHPVAGLTRVGTTQMGAVRVPLPSGGSGNHSITGDQPFGISVYGYGTYTSYWYPGGLDLRMLPPS